jgi:hypothetical protein
MLKELKDLRDNGIYYSKAEHCCLGVKDRLCKEGIHIGGNPIIDGYRHIKVEFWAPADMLAQCALVGHGCAGDQYCAHCSTNRELRARPFTLRRVEEDTSLQKLAHEHDMHAHTLHAINACSCPKWSHFVLLEKGLEDMTQADLNPPVPAEGADSDEALLGDNGPERQTARKRTRQRVPRKPSAPAAGRVDAGLFKKLDGWQNPQAHTFECRCDKCKVPRGTLVRVIPNVGFTRTSEWLSEYWPGYAARLPPCALHCAMRVGEALLLNICLLAIAAGYKAVDALNAGLKKVGLTRQLQKEKGAGGKGEVYGKISLLGFEVFQLLEPLKDCDDQSMMAIEHVLKEIWPTGQAGNTPETQNYVARTTVLWRQWKKVAELMYERDFEVLARDDGHGSGFDNFGKECREFCTLYQLMFHEAHCKSFYLHSLLHHAGDFMRALQAHGLTLGMMSNSGAERRHQMGRLGFQRSLCGGAWKNRRPDLAAKRNLTAYLTLREVAMVWQYGQDLLSHHRARCASAPNDVPLMSFTKQAATLRRCAGAASSNAADTVHTNEGNEDSSASEGASASEIASAITRAVEEGENTLSAIIEPDSNRTQHTTDDLVGPMPSQVEEGNGGRLYDPNKDADLDMDSDSGDSDLGSDDFSSVADDEDAVEFAIALKPWSVWLAQDLPEEDEDDDPSCESPAAKRARRSNDQEATRLRTRAGATAAHSGSLLSA